MIDVDIPKDGYCKAQVWTHTTRCQCSRRATSTGYCEQHFKISMAHGHIQKLRVPVPLP